MAAAAEQLQRKVPTVKHVNVVVVGSTGIHIQKVLVGKEAAAVLAAATALVVVMLMSVAINPAIDVMVTNKDNLALPRSAYAAALCLQLLGSELLVDGFLGGDSLVVAVVLEGRIRGCTSRLQTGNEALEDSHFG